MKNTYLDKTQRKEILNSLYERFQTEYITVPTLTVELFNPKNELAVVTARERVRHMLDALKRRFMKEGIWFGCVDDVGNFGIMRAEAHGRYVVTQYRQRIKGMAIRASQAATEAHLNHLLPSGSKTERLTIPSALEAPQEE